MPGKPSSAHNIHSVSSSTAFQSSAALYTDCLLAVARLLVKYGLSSAVCASTCERLRTHLKKRCGCRKKQSAARADAVTLGDAWLAPAIRAGLLQPIPDAQNSTWWVSRSP